MSSDLRLDQKTQLQQRLNPRQVIFGRFLEMTAPEIEDEVRRELDENPALELAAANHSDFEAEHHSDDDFAESSDELQRADYADADDVPTYALDRAHSAEGVSHEYGTMAADVAGETLIDTLTAQLADIDLTPDERLIAEYIIGNIDDNGYITRSLTDIADDIAIAEGVFPTTEQMKEVFAQVRKLDPAGVAAVDLRDCLLLQLRRMPATLTTRIAGEIMANYFDLFSKKHFVQIESRLGIEHSAMLNALNLIKGLNPKPGALVDAVSSSDRLRHIVPDFNMEVNPAGVANVSLINTVPELAIEESFNLNGESSRRLRRDAEADAFIRRRHDDAALFIDMLKMRQDTLLAVMTAIVKLQRQFFETGEKTAIKPMIIKDVARLTGLDISVISRATAGKYVLTPFGLYPLKLFFNERPKDDSDTSSHQILEALERIIEKEDKTHPLSDEALTRRLVAEGFDLARRTVTKYREKLNQPVARLRKQF